MDPLIFDQGKGLVSRRDDRALQAFKVAQGALARRRWGTAGKFEDDQWMAQHLIHLKQRLKMPVGSAEMRNPDRCIRENETQDARL
jgi:hypothetical protein